MPRLIRDSLRNVFRSGRRVQPALWVADWLHTSLKSVRSDDRRAGRCSKLSEITSRPDSDWRPARTGDSLGTMCCERQLTQLATLVLQPRTCSIRRFNNSYIFSAPGFAASLAARCFNCSHRGQLIWRRCRTLYSLVAATARVETHVLFWSCNKGLLSSIFFVSLRLSPCPSGAREQQCLHRSCGAPPHRVGGHESELLAVRILPLPHYLNVTADIIYSH